MEIKDIVFLLLVTPVALLLWTILAVMVHGAYKEWKDDNS